MKTSILRLVTIFEPSDDTCFCGNCLFCSNLFRSNRFNSDYKSFAELREKGNTRAVYQPVCRKNM